MIYYFWDKQNDELLILGEDGFFYMYGEDTVARDQGKKWQYWMQLYPVHNVCPLNDWERYDILHPITNEWLSWSNIYHDRKLLMEIHRHGRDPDWMKAIERA